MQRRLRALDGIGSDGAAFQTAIIDPLLDVDVRLCFELEVALFGVLAVLAHERALNIDRMALHPFIDGPKW
jgi:hypothetical protein